jgi:DNA recombination protein RmuC
MIFYLLLPVTFIVGAAITWLWRKSVIEGKMVSWEKYEVLSMELNEMMVKHATETAGLQSELTYKQEKLELQKREIENIGERFETQFKVLANSILEDKAQRFSEQQEHNLKAILDPLREHIKTFKADYEVKQNKESEERISLREQIKYMMELNKTLSDQANNLTQALRGNVKQQGNWGEMILESILQYAGLQKGVQYFLQEQAKNGEGNTIQPDVIVRYPDSRAIVIDSKVSLVHYESFCKAESSDEQSICLHSMIRSVKSHIDGLRSKSYTDVSDALDFVMMFVPVEAAYITAMQGDASLWQYAYDRKILLISPTNLIAAMKLVADMWQRDSINREAHLIADKAGKLYDKLVLFVEDFEKVGNQLNRAQDTWQDAYKKLSKGRGNVISQAEQMKGYQAKASKTLPAALVEEALIEDASSISLPSIASDQLQ